MLQYTKLTWYKHVKAKYKGANIKADVTSQVRKILARGAEHVLKVNSKQISLQNHSDGFRI